MLSSTFTNLQIKWYSRFGEGVFTTTNHETRNPKKYSYSNTHSKHIDPRYLALKKPLSLNKTYINSCVHVCLGNSCHER